MSTDNIHVHKTLSSAETSLDLSYVESRTAARIDKGSAFTSAHAYIAAALVMGYVAGAAQSVAAYIIWGGLVVFAIAQLIFASNAQREITRTYRRENADWGQLNDDEKEQQR